MKMLLRYLHPVRWRIALGVSIKYNSEGPVIRLILGPAKITLIPGKKKEKKEKKKNVNTNSPAEGVGELQSNS
mgnify:CR=1 FL=1